MFIVIDAIDGAGKGTQQKEVLAKLAKSTKLEVKGIEFPVHNVFYESVVHPALQEETKLNKHSWVLSFLLDKTMQADEISRFVSKEDNLFVADSYLTTTFAYQCYLYNQLSVVRLERYAEEFEIPKPDLAIFIDVDPKIAMKRKQKEEGHTEGLDMNEKSIHKQYRLQEIYREMVEGQVYCKWDSVDGNGKVEDIRDAIIKKLEEHQII